MTKLVPNHTLNLTDPPEVNDLGPPLSRRALIETEHSGLPARPRAKIFINCATHSSFAKENPIEPITKPNSRRRDMTSARCCCTALICKQKEGGDNKMQPLRFAAALIRNRFHGSNDPALKNILWPHLFSQSRHWTVNVDNIKLSLNYRGNVPVRTKSLAPLTFVFITRRTDRGSLTSQPIITIFGALRRIYANFLSFSVTTEILDQYRLTNWKLSTKPWNECPPHGLESEAERKTQEFNWNTFIKCLNL